MQKKSSGRPRDHGHEPRGRPLTTGALRVVEHPLHGQVFDLEGIGFRGCERLTRDHILQGLTEQRGGRSRIGGPRGHSVRQLFMPRLGDLPAGGRTVHANVVEAA